MIYLLSSWKWSAISLITSLNVYTVGHFALYTTVAWPQNGGSQIVPALKNNHAPEQTSFDC